MRTHFYEVAWHAIDQAIVDGLRKAGRPVPVESVASTCHVVHLCTTYQLRESLARLEEQGLIRRRRMTRRDPRAPLLGTITFDVYEATEVTR